MVKIAFIGAGSTVFAKNLMGDILSFPEFNEATFSLMDIDEARLQTSVTVGHIINDVLGTNATIEATMLDPHTAAELSLDQIASLVDDLLDAHGDMLPQYQ